MFESFQLSTIGSYLPSVQKPTGKLTLREKLKWTGIILVLFFALGQISVWGIDSSAVARFEFLEIVFGSRFVSLITLGIGPIVTASIILQLLVGSKILNWDTKSKEGKEKFTATQKILAIFFCVFEAIACNLIHKHYQNSSDSQLQDYNACKLGRARRDSPCHYISNCLKNAEKNREDFLRCCEFFFSLFAFCVPV